MKNFGEIILNFEDYFNDYMNLDIDDVELFSKTLNKIKKVLKLNKFKLYNEFLPILNEVINFNDNLIMLKIIDNI